LLRILTDPQRPVQLVLAGKAHPADLAGQASIQEWIRFIRRRAPSPAVIFLADYDMRMAAELVQGVDVWINTPQRPWEACGTSGMKVLVNGGLNLSELDGWWAEAFSPQVGWAVGDGREHADHISWNKLEAESLYELLEHEVIPLFYTRDSDGVPRAWVKKIRESMAQLTPQFSANRTMKEYTEKFYLPAKDSFHQRAESSGLKGQALVDWHRELEREWPCIKFGHRNVERILETYIFTVEVNLHRLNPACIRVELYAESETGCDSLHYKMSPVDPPKRVEGWTLYRAAVPAARPPTDYTARIVPCYEGAAIPIEANYILWQR